MKTLSPTARVAGIAALTFVAGIGLGRVTSPASANAPSPLVQSLGGNATTTVGSVLGQGQSPRIPLAGDVEFSQFWTVWNTLRSKYYQQPLSDKELYYGALTGLVAGAGDPYTTFFPPQEAEEFSNQIDGKFEGIGAQIDVKDGRLEVVAPLAGSPAEKAGLRPGDWIVKIDETSTDGMAVDQAAQTIRGPKGTAVTIGIIRDGAKPEPFSLTIVRDEIRMKSVVLTWKPGNIALVEISGFNTDTAELFAQAAKEIKAKNAKGIILDVRNNPGGTVVSAQAVAGAWIGDQVVFKERRQGKVVDSVEAMGKGELAGIPTVVLMNQGSASASEIVAGALQDYGLATTIGHTSFGKGSVQEYQDLPDGSALKITIAEWLTPKDRAINHVGLEPMIAIDRTEADYEAKRDPQLDAAQQFLQGGRAAITVPAATGTREPRL